MSERSRTQELILDWHAGDSTALQRLLERHVPWIKAQVAHRVGPALRARAETQDYLQDTLVEILRHGPRFKVKDGGTFRRLLARVIENTLRDRADWYRARRREMQRERPLPSDTVLHLDAPVRAVPRPSQDAVRHEEEARVRLALELLRPEDRRILLWREWEGRPFEDIARDLDTSYDAARMRFHRSLLRLADTVTRLREGRLAELLGGDESGETG